jgi:hypothetical protein
MNSAIKNIKMIKELYFELRGIVYCKQSLFIFCFRAVFRSVFCFPFYALFNYFINYLIVYKRFFG